ncbi:MAG: 50S ribosomal protein L13 [Candidatus Berkelbacteria bacterium]|nr:MAG: 50S ribosomal protein L13 [Candidatus Berkelbacteria bacterium]QQG52122.1 MAG: 50S ribosomal protein L13 [Candidatus Berkelbacteria bacterium]
MTVSKPLTHTIDAEGKILGRLATEIAVLLRGKNKIGFTFNEDHGDKVIVKNASKIVLTGNKTEQKKYYRHSQYPGALREISYKEMKETHPERIIEHAVKNMLPNNRLRTRWMKRLVIEQGETNA